MTMRCTIRNHGGVPTLFIDEHPHLLLAYKSGPKDLKTYQDFVAAGYRIAHCNIKLENIWLGPQRLALDPFIHSLETILEADPAGYVILELHANAPAWWLQENPEEHHIDRSGLKYGQSMASNLWLQETGDVLTEIVHYSEEHYGDHVVLYLVGAGHTWEWFHRTPLRYVIDASIPMQEAFIAWLRDKYSADDCLSNAWHRDVRFSEISIPEFADVIAGDLGSLRDPGVRAPIYDFFHFYNELMADRIIHFGNLVKSACHGKKLYGAFYGHLLDWLDNPLTAQHSGHFSMEKILESDVVDILAGPNSYMNRSIGHEASFTTAIDSLKLHGKLWLSETDTRTHLADPIQNFCGRPNTIEDSLTILKRDFCHALIKGVDMVWFSLFGGWFNAPEIMDLMAMAHRIADAAMKINRKSIAQIAVVIDEQSVFTSCGRDSYRVDPFISQEPRASDLFAHLGCPYDLYLASDLCRIDTSQYKMFVFLSCSGLLGDRREWIHREIKQNRNVLVWMGLPGLVERNIDANNFSRLISMNANLIEEPSELFLRVLWDSHPVVQRTNLGNLHPYWVDGDFDGHFGTNQIICPRISVKDESATSLGVYSRDGEVGFAIREFDSWNSIFIGTPYAPPAILRQIARWAGVHIYNQSAFHSPADREEYEKAGWNPDDVTNPGDDILYVNDSFLALHTKYKGTRKIAIPTARRIINVFDEIVLSEHSNKIALDCPGNRTYLFYIGEMPWEELFE